MRRARPTLATLIALVLFAVACGDDGSNGDTAEQTTTTAGEPTSESTQPPPVTTEDLAVEPTEVLTASFRGVTAETIKVGVTDPDWDALQAVGVPNYQGETQIAFQPFFDIINANGGIYGRQIEPVYVPFDYTSPTTQEEACIKLTEDEEVFIVLYGLLAENNLCLTDLHDTMVMTRFFQTPELREASGDTLWLQLNTADDGGVMIGALAASGRLDGKNIAVMTSGATTLESVGDGLAQDLVDRGFRASSVRLPDVGTDALARESGFAVASQSMLADGIDLVFDLTGGANAPEVMARNGFTPDWVVSSMEATLAATIDKSTMDGAVTVGPIAEPAVFEDPEFWETCMQVVLDAHPELEAEFAYLPTGEQQAAGEPDWLNPVMHACNYTNLLKLIGEIAGADLTNDSFRAALDDLGPVELYGLGQGTFDSESKWDGLDEFYLQVYDAATDSIVIEGDPVVVERG
jgi:hypothetical protein